MSRTAPRSRTASAVRPAFTLIELLVVIGIIALLISILLPVLSSARQSAHAINCASNLKQVATATFMFTNDHDYLLPYPTTTQGEQVLWFNAIDPYLGSIQGRANATGVAAGRAYDSYKQCVVWDSFEGRKYNGNQNNMAEFARTYKMNSHLRVPIRPALPYRQQASITHVGDTSRFVMFGDALSLDFTGPQPNVWESGQFSFEVNDITQASPAMRHKEQPNIAFVDGHVERVELPTVRKTMRPPLGYIEVDTWESEYIDAAGNPVNPPDRFIPMEVQGLSRNPNMPLIWSELGKLYR